MEPAAIITALAALAAAVLGSGATALKLRRDARRADAAAEVSARESAERSLADAMHRIEALASRLQAAEDAEDSCRTELADARLRLQRLESALPFALADHRLQDMEGLADLLDAATDGWVISTPAQDGALLWCNAALCRYLGRSRDEVLSMGWRGLCHPDDVAETQAAEGAAWDTTVTVVNRWSHADGRWMQLRWTAPRYSSGSTLALARMESVVSDQSEVARTGGPNG